MTETNTHEWRPEDTPRLAPTLEFSPMLQGGVQKVVVRDATTRRYYQVTPEVAGVIKLFDGSKTIAEVASLASSTLQDDVSSGDVTQLVDQLWRFGFLEGSVAPARDPVTWRRRLAIPLVRFESGARFERFARFFAPFFSPKLATPMLLAMGASLLVFIYLFFGERNEIGIRMMMATRDWMSVPFFLALVFPVMVIHEAAHAIAFINFGGRKPRFGVIVFLFVIPAFYTDVNDAYRFQNKWHRIGVSLAGPFSNLLLAIPALIFWPLTQGLLHDAVFFLIMMNMSVVIFTLYPMFRADIYYILVDLLEIPNLQEKAIGYTWGALKHRFGGPRPAVRADGRRQATIFAAYAVLSVLANAGIFYLLFLQTVGFTPVGDAVEQNEFALALPGVSGVLVMRDMAERAMADRDGTGGMGDMMMDQDQVSKNSLKDCPKAQAEGDASMTMASGESNMSSMDNQSMSSSMEGMDQNQTESGASPTAEEMNMTEEEHAGMSGNDSDDPMAHMSGGDGVESMEGMGTGDECDE
ncbi:MAG: M50 family metallopeptidase [Euryarchaeota archaeon]|nr:M50 family metallopeptidase [Euryarchaeota archaeon]